MRRQRDVGKEEKSKRVANLGLRFEIEFGFGFCLSEAEIKLDRI